MEMLLVNKRPGRNQEGWAVWGMTVDSPRSPSIEKLKMGGKFWVVTVDSQGAQTYNKAQEGWQVLVDGRKFTGSLNI